MARIKIEYSKLVDGGGNTKMFANIVIGGQVIIKSCRLVRLPDGKEFVAMPQEKNQKDGKWYDKAKIIDTQLSEEIHSAMRAEYDRITRQQERAPASPQSVNDNDVVF